MVSVSYQNAQHPKYFRYASLPRSLHYSSYRNLDDDSKPFYGNIMYDKRVIRGNTWALRKLAQEALQQELAEERKKNKEKLDWLRESIRQKLSNSTASKSSNSMRDSQRFTKTPQSLPLSNGKKIGSNRAKKLLASIAHNGDMPISELLQQKGQKKKKLLNGFITSGDDDSRIIEEKSEDELAADLEASAAKNLALAETSGSSPQRSSGGLNAQSDAETQVDPHELAVQAAENVDSVADALINQGIESAVKELSEENELQQLREEKRQLEETTTAEREQLLRLQAEISQVNELKESLEREQEQLRDVERKLSSRQVAAEFMSTLVPLAIERLSTAGLLSEPSTAVTTQTDDQPVQDEELQTDDDSIRLSQSANESSSSVKHQHYNDNAGNEAHTSLSAEHRIQPINEDDEEGADALENSLAYSDDEADPTKVSAKDELGALHKEILTDFLPWLIVRAEVHIERDVVSRFLSDSFMCETAEYKKIARAIVHMKLRTQTDEE